MLLAEEIGTRGESLSLQLHILCLADEEGGGGEAPQEIAEAEVGLYVMIEDSCSIVRQVWRLTLHSVSVELILLVRAWLLYSVLCVYRKLMCVTKTPASA
jgi:hypothetical protein